MENEILPLFFEKDENGLPSSWISKIRSGLAASPKFWMGRALSEYRNLYIKLRERGKIIASDGYRPARVLSAWKKEIVTKWNLIDVFSITPGPAQTADDGMQFCVVLDVGEISINDIGVEVVMFRRDLSNDEAKSFTSELNLSHTNKDHVTYELKLTDLPSGSYVYSFRVFPKNPLLVNRQDFPIVKWI